MNNKVMTPTAKIRFILRLTQLERKLKSPYMAHISSHGNNVTLAVHKPGCIDPLVSVLCTPQCYTTKEAQHRTIAEIEARKEWQPYFKKITLP